MTLVHVEAADVSDAWVLAMRALYACPGRRSVHTVVHIADPIAEVGDTRGALDGWLAGQEWYSVETVANTIFPTQIAATSRDHDHLVSRYRNMYEVLRERLFINQMGTYFGRLVAYPRSDGPFDQLGTAIDRMRREHETPGPKWARYEAAIAHPDDLDDGATVSTTIYLPGGDNRSMGFPCLSHCSFQMTGEQVHLLAHYRSQYMVQRGYGNYLGLGRLLAYTANELGLDCGRLTVVAGLAQIERSNLALRTLVGTVT